MKCDECGKELNRRAFCSDRCRKRYVRKADGGAIIVREADTEIEVIPFEDEPELKET